jgi:hypothetical protein
MIEYRRAVTVAEWLDLSLELNTYLSQVLAMELRCDGNEIYI